MGSTLFQEHQEECLVSRAMAIHISYMGREGCSRGWLGKRGAVGGSEG